MSIFSKHINELNNCFSEINKLSTNNNFEQKEAFFKLKSKLNEAQKTLLDLQLSIDEELLTFFNDNKDSQASVVNLAPPQISEQAENSSASGALSEDTFTETTDAIAEPKKESAPAKPIIESTEQTFSKITKDISKTTPIIQEEPVQINDPIQPTNTSEPIQENINEKLAQSTTNINQQLSQNKEGLAHFNFDVNDRVFFQKELFDADPYQFHVSFKKIQKCTSQDELKTLFDQEFATQFDWSEKQAAVTKLFDLLSEQLS